MKRKSDWCITHIDLNSKLADEDDRRAFSSSYKRKLIKVLIIIFVIYLIFLFYGVITTRFYKNEFGNWVAYKTSFSDLKKLDDYKGLKEKLTDVRELIRDITIIDIHLANGDYTNYEAATLYTKLLNERLDVLIPKVNSMNLEDEQESIRKEFESILSYDLALYLQNIIKGLQTGSTETVEIALNYREKAIKTYEIIDSDIKEISLSLKYGDNDFYKWTLNSAVINADNTAVLNNTGGNDNGK